MKKPQRILLALAAALGSHFTLFAQNSVTVEAETGVSAGPLYTGTAGTANTGDWAFRTAAATGTAAAVNYATALTDVAAYVPPTLPGGVGASAPATAGRVLSYTVTFPAPGTYDLYARMRVGPGAGNDDSYFYNGSLGTKNPVAGADWINANGLLNVGYEAGNTLPVDGGGGSGTQVWKWLNMSKYTGYGVSGVTFTVTASTLTQTFQIGAREDGLDFDKFVFGQTGLYYTVANLDGGTPGTTTVPTTFVPTGPPLATGKPKYLGCVYVQNEIPNFDKYWNAVTPGNAGKWGSVESTRGTYNWTELDAAYNQAQAVGGVFRMHTLIWGAQQPTWLYSLSSADQLAAINT